MTELSVRNFVKRFSKIKKDSVNVFFIVEALLEVRDSTNKLSFTDMIVVYETHVGYQLIFGGFLDVKILTSILRVQESCSRH